MAWTTLVDTATVARHCGDPGWVVFDCRFDLGDPGAGERAYERGHVPGAVYAHLDRHLAAPAGAGGRHPLPGPERLAEWLGRAGVDSTSQVVAYDDSGGAFAARLWWLLRWLGHEAVAVLDGGWGAWRRAAGPVARGGAVYPQRAGRFRVHADCLPTVSAAALTSATTGLLVDARSPERFRGEHEPVDPVAGHVPGAVNRPFTANLDETGFWHTPAALRADWEPLLAAAGSRPLAVMCGSGVTACHHVLALAHAGHSGAALYPGSWSEWIRDPARPVATGPEAE